MSENVKIAVVYHSGYGHTKVLAEAVAAGVREIHGDVTLIAVDDPDQIDWDRLADADGIIFGTPTYMGSVSAPFKAFMDASSKVWAEQGWKDKLAAGFTNSASYSGDKLNTLQQLSVFAAQHGMVWVSLGLLPGNNSTQGSPDDLNRVGSYLGVMAQSNADQGPEIVPPQSDRDTAQHLGRRVAQAARRWK
ncbi:flavodoxin family protein [Sedimenticola thiotaurini]|uniref:NADPH-dependent FMN reductase n=1 Tax=Sedimenticola thiotaurini TaxID=1543721 RepID=A0A0F7JYW4_9GAMM|nr:flavodoxin family protein [Sedimenticola thiotaurini]AKH20877.1 NADPH-dependent FMN reductase [Sedimenticola thiotaurini]